MPLDENSFNELSNEFKRVTGELQNRAQSALDEAKRSGDLSKEVKDSVDKLLTDQGELKAQIDDLAQKSASRRGGGEAPAKSFGQMVAEHEDMRALAGRKGNGEVRFELQNAITALPSSGGGLIQPGRDTNVAVERRKLTIKDLVTQGSTDSNVIQYARQLPATGAAGRVPDDGTTLKPQLDMKWVEASVNVGTIAGWIPVHKHMLDDVSFLATEINTELTYQVDLAEEAQILAGDGLNGNLLGLITAATPYAMSTREPAGVTSIDRLRLAMLQVSRSGYVVDGNVLSDIDWALLELQKDTLGRYIFGDPTQAATPRLWGRPVVDSPAMPEDNFLVGAFKLAATYYLRQDIAVRASSEDRDNFVKNMVTVLAEKRAALAVKRPRALVFGDFGRIA